MSLKAKSVCRKSFDYIVFRNCLSTIAWKPQLHTHPHLATFGHNRTGLRNMASTIESELSHAEASRLVKLRYIDDTKCGFGSYVNNPQVGINLGDPVFRGKYHGKNAHEDDFDDVLQRALDVGCTKLMITGSSLKESRHAVKIAQDHPGICFATVGVHPCSANTFTKHPAGDLHVLKQLRELAISAASAGHVAAFGEIGLDYDRLFLADKEVQLKYFEWQLDLAVELKLPLFLHSRAAADDFERLLKPRLDKLPRKGLVHSFTGTLDEMQRLVDLGLDIGVNGCSLKTEENLQVVKAIPLERIQLETDGPWCDIRPSHASSKYLADGPAIPKSVKKEKWTKGCMVKGRNEPCTIPLVAHVVAKVKGCSVELLCEAAWRNSIKMFGLGDNTGT